MIYIKDINQSELKTFLESLGEKPFRARQVYEWIYKGVESFDDMTNLSWELRKKLSKNAILNSLSIAEVNYSEKDDTHKYLFVTADGEGIESVFMKHKYGNSLCVSSQAGCRMGCSFCASAMGGLSRNLTVGEMVDQLLLARRDTDEEIRHIVVMGTGEPFDNYGNVKKFIENICDSAGMGLSRRNITVSTCGIIPIMERFSEDLPQVNLAVSLHAPNDDIRNRIMPINARYPIRDLINASKSYVAATGRRITFEYALIKSINDRPEHAEELAHLLRGLNCHVNLIPLNYVGELDLKPVDRNTVLRFMSVLENKKIQVTIRREMGADIEAACGQLRFKNS